jgi:hypothetical protein
LSEILAESELHPMPTSIALAFSTQLICFTILTVQL